MKKKKVIIFLTSLIVLIGGMFFINIADKSKNRVNKIKREKQNKLAIMIKEDGENDYIKSNSKNIPKGDYVLNYKKSYCKNNGKIGNYDSSLGKVSFSFIGTDSCYLYFDYKEDISLYGSLKKNYLKNKTFTNYYTGSGSDTYAYPVYYYNGDVQDNNVLFGDFCWKIFRTTETGGTKMIYNGLPKTENKVVMELIEQSEYSNLINDSVYPYIYNTSTKYWKSQNINASGEGTTSSIQFTVPEDGDYELNIKMNNSSEEDITEVYVDDEMVGSGEKCGEGCFISDDDGTIELSGLTTNNVIKIDYGKWSTSDDNSDYVEFALKKSIKTSETYKICNNSGAETQLSQKSMFNSKEDALSYAGYMYNKVYTSSRKTMTSLTNIIFGNSFTYENGVYTLKDTMAVDSWEKGYDSIKNNHYTLFSSDTTASNTIIYYVFYTNSSDAYYINLSEGKSVNDAINEMLYADDVNTKDSTIKTAIDKWYSSYLIKYTDRLEDTVFCNDRRLTSLGGWSPDGGITSSNLRFKNFETVSDLNCYNRNDKFTVTETLGNGKLTYPVGLLSSWELRNSFSIFKNEQLTLTMSPSFSTGTYLYVRSLDVYYNVSASARVTSYSGVRPVISLKRNTVPNSGDGTINNPYIVE